jgi:hypothetical protein
MSSKHRASRNEDSLEHDCGGGIDGKEVESGWCSSKEEPQSPVFGAYLAENEEEEEKLTTLLVRPTNESTQESITSPPGDPTGRPPRSRPSSGPYSVPDDEGCGNRFIDGFGPFIPPELEDMD